MYARHYVGSETQQWRSQGLEIRAEWASWGLWHADMGVPVISTSQPLLGGDADPVLTDLIF